MINYSTMDENIEDAFLVGQKWLMKEQPSLIERLTDYLKANTNLNEVYCLEVAEDIIYNVS